MVVFIGLLMAFVSLVYPGANAAWSNLTTTLQVGPQFPTFNNPFADTANYGNYTLTPARDYAANAPSTVHDCDPSNYYTCVNTFQGGGGNESWMWIPVGQQGSYVLNSLAPSQPVVLVTVQIACNATVGGAPYGFIMNITGADVAHALVFTTHQTPVCLAVAGFPKFTFNFPINVSTGLSSGQFSGTILTIEPYGALPNKPIGLAYIAVTVTVRGASPCGALDVGCAIVQTLSPLWMGIQFLVSGIVFVVGLGVGILVFIGQIFFGIMLGLFVSMFYFLNLPGAPSWVQAIIDAVFIGFLIFLSLVIADRAVGLFGGAVNKA